MEKRKYVDDLLAVLYYMKSGILFLIILLPEVNLSIAVGIILKVGLV